MKFLRLKPYNPEPQPAHVTKAQVAIDMKAFESWCTELGVSRMIPKTGEFIVRMGDRTKIVTLNRF